MQGWTAVEREPAASSSVLWELGESARFALVAVFEVAALELLVHFASYRRSSSSW